MQAHAGMLATLGSPSIATDYRAGSTCPGCWPWPCPSPGATEEIVETLAWARDCGAGTLAITNGEGPRSPRRPTWRS